MPEVHWKSNGKVVSFPFDFYSARPRDRIAASKFLEGDREGKPRELFLQRVWQQQRLLRQELTTCDGRKLRVLHPGFWNREAGPDFREAVVQFENAPPLMGDIEIDIDAQNWRGHRHEDNPAYRGVILHVVWQGSAADNPKAPVLLLSKFLDSPQAALEAELGSEILEPSFSKGECATPLRKFTQEELADLLGKAAEVRLVNKAAFFQARAREAGWEQALWEGLMGALGYKNNTWPMRRLAELLPLFPARDQETLLQAQARLLGLAGLLPTSLSSSGREASAYLSQLWDCWWRERHHWADYVLPAALWRTHGLRPANFPQRRLALAAHWWKQGQLVDRVEGWFLAEAPERFYRASLLEILQVETDPFWSWHWTLRSRRLNRPQPLLGSQRLTDLAMNVVLPWCVSRGELAGNVELSARARHRFFHWPPGEENAVLRKARRRLFGAGHQKAKTAAEQQGLMQIVQDFCNHSNALCDDCEFPQLLFGFNLA